MHLENGKEVSVENLGRSIFSNATYPNEHWQTALLLDEEEGYIFRKENQEVKFVDNDATQVFVSKNKELFVRKKPVIRNCLQKQMQFYTATLRYGTS